MFALSSKSSWAENAFGSAHQHLPGNDVVLKGLEKIAILKADDVLRLHWLEAQLRLDPDNPELLRTHAHILVQQGDENAEKDVRRLEALGLDTPAIDHCSLACVIVLVLRMRRLMPLNKHSLKTTRSRLLAPICSIIARSRRSERALEAVDSCLNLDRQVGDAWALRAILLSTKSGREKEA